jgi:alkylhydroperoxidase/carboxymuconolactone decarboxylase family protein YurZ
MITDLKNKIEAEIELLSLISAASVLRDEESLRSLLNEAVAIIDDPKKIYEALLQTYLFAGFPSALISLNIFAQYFRYNENIISTESSFNLEDFRSAGEKNCRIIYGDKFEKLITNVSSFSPELSEWLILEGYGKVFSREGLNVKERELCIVAILTALKFESQLYSHINGAFRVGASLDEIEKVISLLTYLDKSAEEFGMKVLMLFKKGKNLK